MDARPWSTAGVVSSRCQFAPFGPRRERVCHGPGYSVWSQGDAVIGSFEEKGNRSNSAIRRTITMRRIFLPILAGVLLVGLVKAQEMAGPAAEKAKKEVLQIET